MCKLGYLEAGVLVGDQPAHTRSSLDMQHQYSSPNQLKSCGLTRENSGHPS